MSEAEQKLRKEIIEVIHDHVYTSGNIARDLAQDILLRLFDQDNIEHSQEYLNERA